MIIHACPFNFLMQSYHMTMLTIFKPWGVGSTPFPTKDMYQEGIDGRDNTDLKGNFEKILKNQIEIFWNCNNV